MKIGDAFPSKYMKADDVHEEVAVAFLKQLRDALDAAEKALQKANERLAYNDSPSPDNLRLLANDPTFPNPGFWHDRLHACADAWEADIKYQEEYARLWHRDAKRLDAAEKAWNDCNFVELDDALAAGEEKP